jgi:hypothetical protein
LCCLFRKHASLVDIKAVTVLMITITYYTIANAVPQCSFHDGLITKAA